MTSSRTSAQQTARSARSSHSTRTWTNGAANGGRSSRASAAPGSYASAATVRSRSQCRLTTTFSTCCSRLAARRAPLLFLSRPRGPRRRAPYPDDRVPGAERPASDRPRQLIFRWPLRFSFVTAPLVVLNACATATPRPRPTRAAATNCSPRRLAGSLAPRRRCRRLCRCLGDGVLPAAARRGTDRRRGIPRDPRLRRPAPQPAGLGLRPLLRRQHSSRARDARAGGGVTAGQVGAKRRDRGSGARRAWQGGRPRRGRSGLSRPCLDREHSVRGTAVSGRDVGVRVSKPHEVQAGDVEALCQQPSPPALSKERRGVERRGPGRGQRCATRQPGGVRQPRLLRRPAHLGPPKEVGGVEGGVVGLRASAQLWRVDAQPPHCVAAASATSGSRSIPSSQASR